MRDQETMSIALTAAETGHLVLATLHTQDAVQSIDRIIDVFPPAQQNQIRVELAASLQGVVCQALLPLAVGKGRAVATEVMFVNSAIAHMVRDGKAVQIYSALQSGAGAGMHSMDQSLAELVNAGTVTYEVALEAVHDPKGFNSMVSDAMRVSESEETDERSWGDMSNEF